LKPPSTVLLNWSHIAAHNHLMHLVHTFAAADREIRVFAGFEELSKAGYHGSLCYRRHGRDRFRKSAVSEGNKRKMKEEKIKEGRKPQGGQMMKMYTAQLRINYAHKTVLLQCVIQSAP
jgi:hypothetical protein